MSIDPMQSKRAVSASVAIRRAELADAPAIAEIYNEAILTTTATFDTEPKSVEERTRWLQSHDERHPVLVAEVGGKVVGWASLTRWSDRCAYDDTAETSFYVLSTHRGCGIGRTLKEAIIEEARRLRYHTLIARVAEESRESLHLNERAGFVHVGMLKEVGLKFGRRLGVHILQKMLAPQSGLEIREDDLRGPEIATLLTEHLQSLAAISPPESCHALDLERLRGPDVTFWTVWDGPELAGCGALKRLDEMHAEVKSMRTARAHLRKGVAWAVLQHILSEAKRRGYRRVSLETGSMAYFEPARRLYWKAGFRECEPFAGYKPDSNSTFFTREI